MTKLTNHGRFAHKDGLTCTGCGHFLDGWTAVNFVQQPLPSTAKRKTISICAECGALHQFVGDPKRLRFKRLEGQELADALADSEVKRVRNAVLTEVALGKSGFSIFNTGGGKSPMVTQVPKPTIH